MTSTWLVGGTVVDGTGAPPIVADVLVVGDRIAAVAVRGPAGADRLPADTGDATRVACEGLVVAPGFVDEHAHSDISLLDEPGAPSSIEQGVTTQLVGHCGFSAGPFTEASLEAARAEDPIYGFPDVAWTWRTIGGYREVLEARRPATNVATLVGHTTLRRYAMGSADRAPDPGELRTMLHALDAALDDGAIGLSSGLTYPPGQFAAEAELVALVARVGRRGGRYHTHMRGQSLRVRDSLAEAVRTAKAGECALIVSHLYPAFPQAWGQAPRLLEDLAAARRDGADVGFDLTVFPRGGGALAQMVPGWAVDGGAAAFRDRMSDPGSRARLADELRVGGNPPGYPPLDWDDQLIVKVRDAAGAFMVGRSIGDLARERSAPPEETAIALLELDLTFWVAPTIKSQADLDCLIADPACAPVIDGMSADPARHASLGLMPKSFGTFPHVLGSYVRERGVLELADAIHRMAALPAARLGLADRGVVRPGAAADLVVFDPDRVANRAGEEVPHARPAGIERVMVNGRWAVVDGQATGIRPGRVL